MRKLLSFIVGGMLATVSLVVPLSQHASALGGSYDWVSRNSSGALNDAAGGALQSLSSDGRYVLFSSTATNVVPNDTNGHTDYFVRDRQTQTNTLVSVGDSGQQGNDDVLPGYAGISGDGRYVVFSTRATNFTVPDNNGSTFDTYVRDIQAGTTTLVCSSPYAGYDCDGASISKDGQYITYRLANPFAFGAQREIYRLNRVTGQNEIVSMDGQGYVANNISDVRSRMSADGRYVVFMTNATNLVAGDTNGKFDIFRKDMQTGSIALVSTTSTGAQANNDSEWPTISDDGRYVAFSSVASNLTANDTNGNWDMFAKDMDSGTLQLVGGALNVSLSGSITGDGSQVVFETSAALTANDTNGTQDVYSWNRTTGVNTRLSEAADGSDLGGGFNFLSTNTDGRFTLLATGVAINPGDTQPGQDLYVYDQHPADTVRPTVSFTAPASFATPFTTGPTVTIAASDSGSGLQSMAIHVYTSSNQLLTTCGSATPAQVSAGSMSCDLSSLPNGTYYIKAGAFDNAGNNKTINSGNFVINH